MYKVLVFAGTHEGFEITDFLVRHKVAVYMCAATAYGARRFEENEYLTISSDRLDEDQMISLMEKGGFDLTVDATHPFATEVTKNILAACEAAGLKRIRIIREAAEPSSDCMQMESLEAAIDYLDETTGNILVTTGSKELHRFTRMKNYQERLYVRVLSLPQVVSHCGELGFEGKHLICMQGPFSREMNVAMLKQYECRYLLTKEAGSSGGFEEKYLAAQEAGAILVVIGRPVQEEGMTLEQCREYFRVVFKLKKNTKISLVGIGPGAQDHLTQKASECCRKAQCLIGGRRLVDSVAKPHQACHYEYHAEKIRDYIEENPQWEHIAIVLSGDVGFYSGAARLVEILGPDVEVICGISSVVYFMSRIHLSWEDAVLVSAHGRECNYIHYIRHHKKSFSIIGDGKWVGQLAEKLVDYGMDQVTMYVGENLSYPEEKILSGKPADFLGYESSSLAVICVLNDRWTPAIKHLRDEEFLRAKVPMTKEEVRWLSVDKLHLTKESVCYDVGAGTGSVTMEMASQAYDGKVYAIEKKQEAIELIKANGRKLVLDNIVVVEREAPAAMDGLEAPTHVFIGGSSGNLREIMECALDKNPTVGMVINCIALETVSDAISALQVLPVTDVQIVQISVSKSKEVGKYHMMMGENPIYVISCRGKV